jgi:hypothetical protein
VASNKGRAYFGLSGYHFNPDDITSALGIEPTSTNNAGMTGSLDKPVISSWEFSTDISTNSSMMKFLKRLSRLKIKLSTFVKA